MGSAASEMMERYPAVEHLIPQFHKLYLAETYLAPEATRQEQIILLQNLGISVNLGAFIDGEFPDCQGQKHAYPKTVQERQDKQLRERVIEAAFEKVRAGHTYAHRVDFWRTIWEKI